MSKNKQNAPQDDPPPNRQRSAELDPTVKLEIREQVEQRVEKEIAKVTKFYNTIGIVVIVAFGIAGVYSVRDLTQKFLNTTEAAAKVKAFTEQYGQFQASYSEYTNRLAELKAIDDIVTAKDLNEKIQSINKVMVDSQKTLKQLKDASDFYFSLADVHSFRRSAFEKLRLIASDKSNQFSARANNDQQHISRANR